MLFVNEEGRVATVEEQILFVMSVFSSVAEGSVDPMIALRAAQWPETDVTAGCGSGLEILENININININIMLVGSTSTP